MLILANFTSSRGHDVVALHDLFDGTVLESSLYTEEKTWAV